MNGTFVVQAAFYTTQSFCCQAFFAYRIYVYSTATSSTKKRIYSLLGPIILLLAINLAFSIFADWSVINKKIITSVGAGVTKPSRFYLIPSFISSLALDLTLTYGLVSTFKRARNGFSRSDNLLDRLTRIAWQTGAACCAATIVMIISEFTRKGTIKVDGRRLDQSNLTDRDRHSFLSLQSICYLLEPKRMQSVSLYQNCTQSASSVSCYQDPWTKIQVLTKG